VQGLWDLQITRICATRFKQKSLKKRCARVQTLALELGVPATDIHLELPELELRKRGKLEEKERRSLGGIEVTVSISSTSGAGGIVSSMVSASFASRISISLSAQGFNVSVAVTSPPEMSSAMPAGEVWEWAGAGDLILRACPEGQLLVNSSISTQRCMACEPDTYTTHDALGCRREQNQGSEAVMCHPRPCLECPAGLSCVKGKAVLPDDGSVWLREGDHIRVSSCAPGSLVYRSGQDDPRNARFDACVACSAGFYSLERAYYSQNGSAPILQIFGNEPMVGKCLACPVGGICSGGSAVAPQENYWLGSPMLCPVDRESGAMEACATNPAFSTPPGRRDPRSSHGEEKLRRAELGGGVATGGAEGRRQGDGGEARLQTRLVHRIYRCPPKVCLSAALNFSADNGSNCLDGHHGVACAVCRPGFGMKLGGVCQECRGQSEEASVPLPAVVAYVIVGSLIMVLWYILAWRPLILHSFDWEERCLSFGLGLFAFPFVAQCFAFLQYLWQALSRNARSTEGFVDSAHLRSLFKILAGFMQIVGSFFYSFRIEWPPIFDKLRDLSTIFQVDLFSVPNTACILSDATYFHRLIVKVRRGGFGERGGGGRRQAHTHTHERVKERPILMVASAVSSSCRRACRSS